MKTPFALRKPTLGWRTACLAAASAVALTIAGCGSSGSSSANYPSIVEAFIDTQATQIGGATTAVELFIDGSSGQWTLYSMANRFAVTQVGMDKDAVKAAVKEIAVPGYIQNITVASYGTGKYALLSMGGKGIGVVDITNPATPVYVSTMTVAYTAPAYHAVDGGGTEFDVLETAYTSGPVSDLLVDDLGTSGTTADDMLYIANGAYGIQKTLLSNLLAAPASGALAIDNDNDTLTPVVQAYTLKYAGENPWGGPQSLKMHGGKLYAALGFLGMSIYDPATLVRLGAYNKYADCTPAAQEDWFGKPNLKISCPGTSAIAVVSGVDSDGMPTWQQAKEELANKNMDGIENYPWASFDRYGKYYYNARTMELQVVGGRTMAYIAYSLGGLVAVDVTTPGAITYAGYVPAAPAHGPDEPPINVDKKGILSHFGSGMLKEAGVMDVRVVPDSLGSPNYKAYYTDHFAGLVVVGGAEDPAMNWKNGAGGFNNDTDARVFWPDYEFVTSYDMTPVPVGDESLPAFLVPATTTSQYAAPVLLSTGEINGHGGALFLMPTMNTGAAGAVDAVQSSGAGGVSYVDFIELSNSSTASIASRFTVPVNLVSTNEVGAAVDGSATQAIAIGHAEGVTVSGNYLYLGDGPHGTSVWTIANGLTAIDDLKLVANTLADEYPDPAFPNVIPTPHAFKVGFGDDPTKAYVMSQSLGMRRVDVSAVTTGIAKVGTPSLLNAFGGVYEHNTAAGALGSKVTGQDHAYGVTFSGKYAFVADGDNGLTVYDTSITPDTLGSHIVANIGDADGTTGKPPLGRASAVKLWTDTATGKTYAVVAAGAYGVSVVDMTAFLVSGLQADLGIDKLLKTFEPIKVDEDNAFGSADGKSVDIHVIGDIAYLSYDSYGIVAYRMADLVRPLSPAELLQGCTPTKLLIKNTTPKVSCRPEAAGRFKLQIYGEVKDSAGVVTTPSVYADVDGGAQYMTPQYFPANTPFRDWTGAVVTLTQPKLLFYVAYAEAGVVKLDWSNVANPQLLAVKEVVGGASATAINNGRVYVAAGAGGLVVLKK